MSSSLHRNLGPEETLQYKVTGIFGCICSINIFRFSALKFAHMATLSPSLSISFILSNTQHRLLLIVIPCRKKTFPSSSPLEQYSRLLLTMCTREAFNFLLLVCSSEILSLYKLCTRFLVRALITTIIIPICDYYCHYWHIPHIL